MKIQLSDHFTYGKLIRFTLPSVAMMIFTSIYGVVDGYFVSNYVGKTPFAAVNFIWPFLMMLSAVGFMFGTGGSALVAKTMGEQEYEKANSVFSLFVYVAFGLGIIIMLFGLIFLRPVAALLGVEGTMLEDCVTYGRIILLALPACILQMEFQSFFITAEKPQLGLAVTVISGVTNMVLDAMLVAVIPLGLVGAALATALSQVMGGIIPLIYFFRPNTSLLRLAGTHFDWKALVKACSNGFSELLSNISMSLVNMLYNIQLIRYAGEDGVAAYGVVMYVCMIFLAIFIGYSIGTAPVVGYHFGACNHMELKSLLRKSLIVYGIVSVCMVILSLVLAVPLSNIFVGYDNRLLDITIHGFRVFSFSYLFSGFAIFASSFFTALNDGMSSALISFMRTLVFQIAAVMLLPLIWELDGIWLSIVVAEALAVVVAVGLLYMKRKKYQYW